MKEELNTLKDSMQQIAKAYQYFQKQREFFNMKVEEKLEETGTKEVILSEDSYDSAKVVCVECSQLNAKIKDIRNEHPKYGNKRIRELVIDEILPEHAEQLYSPSRKSLEEIIDIYFLYESCGFFKLYKKELEIINLEKEVRNAADNILDESKDSVKKIGASFINIVKPYGEVAKSQLNDAGDLTKKAVNKGSRQLIKFFENIEEKTKSK